MGLFGGLYVAFCLALGLTLAILLDQKIRGEGILRPVYLYPLALSFIVTGTAWKLFLDPRLGLEKAVHDLGWSSFHFDWVVNPRMMIYCVAIAGVWQTSGFVMAMFLAALRGIDSEILKAAQIDGASAYATYRRIVIPIMRPVFLSAIIVLAHMAIKSYDLVLSVTGKNPGGAAELPSTFMYSYTFTRSQMAVGSTSAVIMLMTIAAIMVPYLYSELREKHR
jgi:glucose/mannose transport system permease protein